MRARVLVTRTRIFINYVKRASTSKPYQRYRVSRLGRADSLKAEFKIFSRNVFISKNNKESKI